MAERPSDNWRQQVAEEAAELAAGRLDPEKAYATQLFPEPMLSETDEVLAAFEAEIRWAEPPVDEEVFGVIERTVLALNEVNDRYEGAAYETDEREMLCAYIEASLREARVDVDALASRRGIHVSEITDDWRDW
ncbi:hypothetical protein [Plantactinospora soyae]|uniref:Uncharacterized protein n=1 Tax=Plantactinospora soyae TaxID=1544732 RepID=A0A927M3K8_9ACTN|nr:hypothetical protein [Plantactinospora soyae]MBE1486036.1 hypothetical protein [Plantactinospora soyae]